MNAFGTPTRSSSRVGIAVLAAALCLPQVPATAAAHPAGAHTAVTADTPDRGAAGASSAEDRAPLSDAEVAAQVKQAEELRARFATENEAVAAASAALEKSSDESTAAMEKLANARRTLAQAEAEEETQRTKLRRLTAALNAAKEDVRAMAVDAYTSGTGSLEDVAAVMSVITGSADELSSAALAAYLADSRAADKDKFTALAAEQQKVAAAAAKARLAREKAAAEAEAAKAETDAKLEVQRAALAQLQADVAATATSIEKTDAAIEEMKKAQAAAAAKAAAADAAAAQEAARSAAADAAREAAKSGRSAAGTAGTAAASVAEATCADDTRYYPNGQLPSSAMCRLETAPNHMLRPAAAEAYDRMSRAYQEETGGVLCITDSYRSLASQVDVRARKPTLAAVPGTSNHGLGLAVDLCGGVENFGTPAHQWMKQRAPLFGFFHPAWAQANGSKPEPWHWEFVG